ncbi:hypothetical protein ACIHCV_40355 [Streptomyces sp. NPDC051956]|uniref:hypothetical protein n=1 Tax=Streptomyces sp. NPDC051956 TaxID=3365677 RepID=UPI0037CCCB87
MRLESGECGPATRAQLAGTLLQPRQQLFVAALPAEGLAQVARLDTGPVGGDLDQGAAAEYQEGPSVHASGLHLSQGGPASRRAEWGGLVEGWQPVGPFELGDHGGENVEDVREQ